MENLIFERRIAKALKSHYEKTTALSKLLQGDVELFGKDTGEILNVLIEMICDKGYYTNIDLMLDYCSGDISFNEAIFDTGISTNQS